MANPFHGPDKKEHSGRPLFHPSLKDYSGVAFIVAAQFDLAR